MLIITDINGNIEALSGYRGLQRKRNVSGVKSLAFLILPTTQNAHSFPMVEEESIVEFDGESYRIKQIAEKPKGSTFYKEVVAVHTFFDLIDDHIYTEQTGSLSLQSALQTALGGSAYTWDIVDSFLAQDWENFGDDNRLALFQTVLEQYGAEFTLIGKHLTLRKKIGNATDFQFRYNYNVKTLSRDVKTNNLSTYIKGFGKQNEDGSYVVESEYTSPNAVIFGTRHAKPVRDEKYTTLVSLNERLKAEIIDTPEISITVDFADMRRAGFPYDVPNEGDDVFLIYEPMGIDIETRIMEVDEEFAEGSDLPNKTSVTLANIRSSTIKYASQTSKQVNSIVTPSGKIRYNVLDEAVKRATEALQSAQTELEFDNGIIARSKINPNHLVLLNSAGVGISTDGGATFKDAIVAGGVVTSSLTAGQINANNISVRGGGVSDYSLTDSTGFFAKGTAFRVERSDGYVSVNNGIIQHGFAVQGSYPPFRTAGIVEEGPWLSTLSANRYENIQMYTFKHDSRYLVARIGLKTENTNYSVMYFDVDTSNGSGDTAANIGSASMTGIVPYYVTEVTMDLGIPDGSLKVVYVRLNTSNTSMKAYGRILNIRQEG